MFASAVRLASKSAPLLAGSAAVGGGRAGAGVSRRAVATATAVVGGAALWLASEQGRTVSSAAAEKVVVAFGWNQYGQLGIGNEADQPQPQEIGLEGVAPRSVAAGSKSSAIVTVNGELYTFGCSKDGRLGHGFSAAGDNETMPRLVSELTGTEIKSVAVGDAHMAAVTSDGQVWTWGKGKIGHANSLRGTPGRVEGLDGKRVTSVACGFGHTVAVTDDGEVFTWGVGRSGALGTGSKSDKVFPVQVLGLGKAKIVQVACGREHTLALAEDGVVYAWGSDDDGAVAAGAGRYVTSPQVVRSLRGKHCVKVVAGEYHSIAIDDSGAVFTWGGNFAGQLGHGDRSDVTIAREVRALEGVKIVDGAAGNGHTVLLDADGKMHAFGRGRNGQLGRGTELESVAAIRMTPVRVDSVTKPVRQVACGAESTLALIEE